MARKKTVPAAYAVLPPTKATKAVAALGKTQLMERVRSLTGDGEAIVSALLRVLKTGEKDSDVIRAAETLLAYGYGKPVETVVTADATPRAGGVGLLTNAALEAVAVGRALPVEEVEGEVVGVAPA